MKFYVPYIILLLSLPLVAMGQKGIDVSRYQDTINWKRVQQSKAVDFVYIKATEGASIKDKMYKYNVKKAREHGLKVGSYHVYSSRTSAYDQFNNFKSLVKKDNQDLVPVLDIEAVHCHKLYMTRVDKLLELMEKEYGCKPMIYTSEKLYMTHFNNQKYQKYHFWIANYNRKPNMAYTLWQYTQDGQLKGVRDCVDFSRFNPKYGLDNITMPNKKKAAVKDTVSK